MKKRIGYLMIWVVMAVLGFWFGVSRLDYDLQKLDRNIINAKNWQSYTIEQRFGSQQTVITQATGKISTDPTRSYFHLSTPIEFQKKNFELEVYEAEGNIFLHPLDGSNWYKTDFTHPAVKELDPLFHPFDLWDELLHDTDHVEKVEGNDPSLQTYRLVFKEKPEIALYHIMLHEVKELDVDLSFQRDTEILREAKLHVGLDEPDVMTQSSSLDYVLRFTDINNSVVPTLPGAAKQAETLK